MSSNALETNKQGAWYLGLCQQIYLHVLTDIDYHDFTLITATCLLYYHIQNASVTALNVIWFNKLIAKNVEYKKKWN